MERKLYEIGSISEEIVLKVERLERENESLKKDIAELRRAIDSIRTCIAMRGMIAY